MAQKLLPNTKIFRPALRKVLDLSVDSSRNFQVKLTDPLTSSLSLQKVRDYSVAWVDGTVREADSTSGTDGTFYISKLNLNFPFYTPFPSLPFRPFNQLGPVAVRGVRSQTESRPLRGPPPQDLRAAANAGQQRHQMRNQERNHPLQMRERDGLHHKGNNRLKISKPQII